MRSSLLPDPLSADTLRDAWPSLSAETQLEGFYALPRDDAGEFFQYLDPDQQAELLDMLPVGERRLWIRLLEPDDVADLLQEAEHEQRRHLLRLLDDSTRHEVTALLAYAEDHAGGLMSPRFARLRPEMRVDEAIRYLRRQAAARTETIYYVYVLDPSQKLMGVVSFRDLFAALSNQRVQDVMESEPVTVRSDADQEAVARILRDQGLLALPVVDDQNRMQGIVTFDDILDVVEEEATEDFHQLGGVRPIDTSVRGASLWLLYRRRILWLLGLVFVNIFSGASIAAFETTIEAVVALVFFLPLLIDSGGNAGSQSATLMVRALATGDVRIRDWMRLLRRELAVSVSLGATMAAAAAALSFFRAPEIVWVVAGAMVLIVMIGSLVGMSLPFLMTRLRIDPATASAPLITSITDIIGVLTYFSLARTLLDV